jgi:hypothetical protein
MLVVGFPLRGLLGRRKALDESAWIDVPLLGLTFTLFVLQFLVYLNVPVRQGVWVLAAPVGGLWVGWLSFGPVRESLRRWPHVPFGVAAAVLVIQAGGLFLATPSVYAGRAWTDQFNYTTMAEFFRDDGYDLTPDTLGQRPWLLRVLGLKHFRIGQSVLQAYHAVLTAQDTRDLFMPTILLCGPLLALALYAAGRALGLATWPAALAAALGGLTPGVTSLMLECFQSHALALPLLLSLPTILFRYNARRDGASLAVACMVTGALVSIYTEFLPLIAVPIAFFFLHACTQRPRTVGHLASFGLVASAPVLFNPWCLHSIRLVFAYGVDQRFILAALYPWAYKSSSLPALWVGDFVLQWEGWRGPALWLSSALVAGGVIGLIVQCVRAMQHRHQQPGSWGLPVALAGLTAIPAVLWLKDREHPYQLFKILVTFSPLLALGVAALSCAVIDRVQVRWPERSKWRRLAIGGVWSCFVLDVAVVAGGSLTLSLQSGSPREANRSVQHVAQDNDLQTLRQHLATLEGHNLLYRASAQGLKHFYQHLWIMYHGRHNRLWLSEPLHNDLSKVEELAGGPNVIDLRTLPANCLVLSPRHSPFLQPPEDLPPANVLWQSSAYLLWQPADTHWACLSNIEGPPGAAEVVGNAVAIGNAPTVLRLFAAEAGWVRVAFDVERDGELTQRPSLHLLVKHPNGVEEHQLAEPRRLVLHVQVQRGLNNLSLQVADLPELTAGSVTMVVREVAWQERSANPSREP